MTDLALPEHTLVDGRYRLVDSLGAGDAGWVWSAVDLRLRRSVALKVLTRPAEHCELAAAASTWTAGLTRVYDAGRDLELDGRAHAYLVREIVPGASFDDWVDVQGLPAATTAALGACVATTLAGVHLLGVAHGGVSGANIVLPVPLDARAVLTDFGTRTAAGGRSPRAADDVRRLGEVLLGAVTGCRVVGPRTTLAGLRRLRRAPGLRPRERQAWAETLAPMLAADPSARPSAVTSAVALATLGRETASSGSTCRPRGRAGVQPPPWEAVFSI